MENTTHYTFTRSYVEESIKRTLTDTEWQLLSRELIEMIDSDLYDRLVTIRWSFDETMQGLEPK
jgi:hypothetical protein